MFSTFQAIAKVVENLENTNRDTMCNLQKQPPEVFCKRSCS